MKAIEKILESQELDKKDKAEFLRLWCEGVELVGRNYFIKDDELVGGWRPNSEVIAEYINVMSGGERRFIVGMHQLYTGIQSTCSLLDVEPMGLSDFGTLDREHKRILSGLIRTYNGM